ncbi:MAG TPA: DUF6353 family protein [Scandinavium sp.]|jgi:hypothetical protein
MNSSLLSSRILGSSKFFLQRNAPTILTGAGIAGFAITTALTIRATAKAADVFPEISKDVVEVKNATQDAPRVEKQKALTKVYLKSSVKLAELYWPVLVTGSASVVCVISAHGLMLQRQTSLVAAYTALDAGYKAYRRRVAEVLGDEKEEILYRGARTVKGVTDDGTEGEVIDYDDVMPSPYARFFDEASVNWTRTPEYNLLFLRSQQNWANDRLQAHGFIFLNEVYEALGLERSQAGQIVGWRLNGNGDGHVDFGLYNIGDECNRAFINGIEHTVLLDFNVDGPIKI